MNRKFSVTLLAATAFLGSHAQDATVKNLQAEAGKVVKSSDSDGWKKGGSFALNVNQGSLTNWAGGGEQNTIGINGILNYGVNYRKGKSTWDNYFDIALGFQNATSFRRFRKTDDRIDITSKYGRQVSSKWYAAALVNFNTQALIGYDYGTDTKISNFLTPGKLLVSLGMDYRPADNFSIFISPVTSRWITKQDQDFLYG